MLNSNGQLPSGAVSSPLHDAEASVADSRGPAAPSSSRRDDSYSSHALGKVREALHGLRYGEVTIVVQDGVVVQVERTEKVRLARR